MNYKVAQAVGLNTDQKAAQVITSFGTEQNLFLGVLSLECDDAFTRGRQILSELSDYYLEEAMSDQSANTGQRLKDIFSKALEKLADANFDLLLAAISGKVLYLISQGEVKAYLKRDNKLSALLDLGQQGQLISGFLQVADRVFLATANLAQFLGDDLEKSLNLSLSEWEEETSSKVGAGGLDDQSLAGLIVDIVEGEEKEEKDEAIPTLTKEEDQALDSSPQPASGLTLSALFSSAKRLTGYFPKTGRGRLVLAIVLILIIGLGVGYQIRLGSSRQKSKQFSQAFTKAQDDFNAALNLQTLNPKEAKDKLDSAKSNLNAALAIKPKDKDVLQLKDKINQNQPQILQQFQAGSFPVFLDLDLVKKGFSASWMSLSSGNLLILDPQTKTLVSIDLAKKSNQILAGQDQLGDAAIASLNDDFAFSYSKDKGVVKVDIVSKKATFVAKKDDDLGSVVDLAGFSGNVYLLDSLKNQIWKYLPTSSGYSDKRQYFTQETKADLAGSLRMQIESSVYVLKKGGEILRFTKGASDHFSLSGLDKAVKDPKSFFVSSDTDNLYLLDSGNSRLVILSNTGEYKGQISGDKFASASDLAVDEKGKKVYLLDGSKIYTADLK